jgi:hypothetical protein
LTKKNAPAEIQRRPFFKAWPSNFLGGCVVLTAEEKGVYYTLLMLLYDKWEPVDDRTVKKRQELARICGLSTRGFGTIVERLVALPGKLKRDADGLLTNSRFERARGGQIEDRFDLEGEKKASKSFLNGPLNDPLLNDNNGLDHARARVRANLPESRVHIPEQSHTAATQEEALKDEITTLETELSQICRALGVTLQADTKRITWPQQLQRLKAEHGLDVQLDILPAIESYAGQLKGETVRSLMYLKDRALERKAARLLHDRIAGVTRERTEIDASKVTRDDWSERLKMFIELGTWAPSLYGPSPLEPGCLVPADMLTKAERYWIDQGNHPRAMHHGGTRVDWQAGKAGMVRESTPFARRSASV